MKHIGYCTNVHAGADLEQTRTNLQRYACRVKELHSPDTPMGVGLWLSASAARKLIEDDAIAEFKAWLADSGLVPFTLNGFPFGDFHRRVVKHDVYKPTWFDQKRYQYTSDLIAILHAILPAGIEGSISTLPIAWGQPSLSDADRKASVEALRKIAADLAKLEKDWGRLIYLCLEPEPGCVFERSPDVVRFFEDHLLVDGGEAVLRRHLRVCHDVCHQFVMFEDQSEVLDRYRAAGIQVGKMQISSAVCLPRHVDADRDAAFQQLAGFNEDRYLHQTVCGSDLADARFYEDLDKALASKNQHAEAEWRVHFHVPIYLQTFGHLHGSQQAIVDCFQSNTVKAGEVTHFEVETYAWGVLPSELQVPDLAIGIAKEMDWFRQVLS